MSELENDIMSHVTLIGDSGITIPYVNYKGKFDLRHVEPLTVEYGSTEWHGEAYTLTAYDYDKAAKRQFNINDILRGMAIFTLKSVDINPTESRIDGIMKQLMESKL